MSFTDTAHQTGGLVAEVFCHRTVLARKISATSLEVAGYVMCSAGVVRAAAGSLRWNPCPQREVVQSEVIPRQTLPWGAGVQVKRVHADSGGEGFRASSQIFRSPRSYLAHNARSIFISWANPSCVNPGFSRCSRIRFATSRFKYPFSS